MPAPTSSAPSPAPAPAPSAPPADKPATTTPPPAPAPSSDAPFDLGDISKELDELNVEFSKPAKKTEPPKSPDKPTDKPEDKPEAGKPEDKPATTKPEEDQPKPTKAAELRTAYENLKKKVREEYEPELGKLRAALKEFQEGKHNEPLLKELEAIKKRRDELENEIKFVNYQKSAEFQEKYAKPYQEAWDKAVAEISEISVIDADGNTRPATAQDLLTVANLPLGEARKLAREMFGEAAEDVMAHRRKIRELYAAQQQALEEAQQNLGEREKTMLAQRQAEHQETIKLWRETNEALAKKYPNWFAEAEGDQEGNELLRKGFALADLHFVGVKDLSPEQIEMLPERFRDALKTTGKLSRQDRIALDALLRNKIASHSRLALKLKRAAERIKQLEKDLAEYEKSTPTGKPASTDGTAKPASIIDEANAELDQLDKQFR